VQRLCFLKSVPEYYFPYKNHSKVAEIQKAKAVDFLKGIPKVNIAFG
jgi:hypothetical protein